MTKRLALHMAIEALSQQPLSGSNQEAINMLQQIETEVCRKNWTEENIKQAIETWKETHGTIPIVADLGTDGLPSKFIVQRVFKENASVVLSKLYPNRCTRSYCERKYFSFTKEQLVVFFKQQIEIYKPKSGRDYNIKRIRGTPTWEFAARRLNCGTWDEFYYLVTGNENACKPHQECKVLKIEIKSDLADALKQITRGEE